MKSQLRLYNKTDYLTSDLRRFILAGLRFRGIGRRVTVKVTPFRRDGCSGWAVVGGSLMQMNLPPPERLSWKTVAQVLIHEIDHLLGLRHSEMGNVDDLPTHWAENLSLRLRPPAPRVLRGRARPVEKKLAEARARTALYAKKEQAALRLRKKWDKKVTYYEKRAEFES